MQAARRLATPARVHQFWDVIRDHNGPLDFEKLMSLLTTTHKIGKDELNHELNYAIKDGLVISEAVETQKREETEVYKIPKVTEGGVQADHDWYCFQCHLGSGSKSVVECEDCPRVYHLDCLPEDRKPEKDLFVCPSCSIVSSKPSGMEKKLGQKTLNQLLRYICDRFKSWQIEALENMKSWGRALRRQQPATKGGKGEDSDEGWRLTLLVRIPMDLQTMITKTEGGKYTSLEEFQVDCETLVHAMGVYFGSTGDTASLTKAFLRDALHEIQEIKLCHDCFRRSNERLNKTGNDWWFCLPCTVPHEVVWAKQTGYPFWPAKVMKKDGNKYDVRYFGGNYERGIIDAKNIQPIETSIQQLKVRRTTQWNDAYDELQKFQEIKAEIESSDMTPGVDSDAKLLAKLGKFPTPVTPAAKKSRTSTAGARASTGKKPAKETKIKQSPQQTPKTSRKSGAAKSKASPKTEVATPTKTPSKTAAKTEAAAETKVKTPQKEQQKKLNQVKPPSTLDPEVIAFLNEVEDDLEGDAYFSDGDDGEDKVSEDPVDAVSSSSSSSLSKKPTRRNVYAQVDHQGLVREKLIKVFSDLQTRHQQELSQNKKKQWCYNCEREAIYHCCWNTAYCSIECQQVHWTREHKRLCRRKKPV